MNTTKYRTVTLTHQAPVRINEALWPVIAVAKDWDNQHEFQANRRWDLRVRQHEDGRALVYGTFTSAYHGEPDRAGGELVASGADLIAAIRRVGAYLGFGDALVDDCIADLPAVDLE